LCHSQQHTFQLSPSAIIYVLRRFFPLSLSTNANANSALASLFASSMEVEGTVSLKQPANHPWSLREIGEYFLS